MDTAIQFIARAVDKNGIDPNNLNTTTTDPKLIDLQKDYCEVGKCPLEWAIMHYRPTIPGNAAYAACFVILLLPQLWFGIRKKTWNYMVAVCLGILGETIGYVGRVMYNRNPFPMRNFLLNLVPLTVAPALLTAGIYLCLGRVITAIGSKLSILKPKWYTIIFVGCDLVALILQSAGGAISATADDKKGSDLGVNIMIAGLVSQCGSMVLFFGVWGHFVFRTQKAKRAGTLRRVQPPLYEYLRSTQRFKLFQWSLFTATVCIFIRSVYRVAELWEGFDGHLANHESSFMAFEGPFIIVAVLVMTIWHPGRVFDDLWVPAGKGALSEKLLSNNGSATELTDTAYRGNSYNDV